MQPLAQGVNLLKAEPVVSSPMEMFLGLYTLIYPAADLQKSKQWFEKILGKSPYFDQPFYVGFELL